MKRYLIIILLLFSFGSFAQNTIKISELPAYSANPSGGILPLVVGGSTKKFDAVNFVWTGGAYANPNWITSLAYSKLTGKPTTASGYGITDLYTQSQIQNFFSGTTGITGYNHLNWDAAYAWGNHSGLYRPISYVPAWSEITGKPSFATVANSGAYADLTGKPDLSVYALTSGLSSYVTNSSFTWANLGGKPSTFTPATHTHLWADVTNRPTLLSNFTNDLGNYGGFLTGINSTQVTSALGYTPENVANKGAANGYASLGPNAKILTSQLPDGSYLYKGKWNASTNTPTLANGTGTSGWTYRVEVGGTQNLGAGNITFVAGDDVIYNGTIWEKTGNTNLVTSVNGLIGDVTISIPTTLPASDVYAWAKAATKPTYAWSEITSKPTALSAFTNDLGNYGGFLTSFTESDPTVYAWAKAATKPTYAWSEITGKPTALSQFTNDLGNYGGFLTSFTETDPSVYAWAKAATKPTYTKTEIGLSNVVNILQWHDTNHPTTIAGYGITDIPTSLPASDVYAWAKAATKPSYAWSEITAKPTALSAFTNDLGNYGGWITGIDFSAVTTALAFTPVTNARTITINGTAYDLTANRSWTVGDIVSSGTYSNPAWITSLAYSKLSGVPAFLTSYTETDPTVYAWAKAATKPSYAWSEITAKPTALSAFTNDLGNYGSFLTSESDPSVYAWAKASTKPSYAWSEITSKPTALSAFTNDLGNYGSFLTSESDPLVYTWAKSPVKPAYTYAEIGGTIPTWNQNTNGTAANATNWGGSAANFSVNVSGADANGLAAYNATTSRFEYLTLANAKTWFGFGSYAYRSSGLAELTGATFTGNISGVAADFSSIVKGYSFTSKGISGGWDRSFSFEGSTGTNRGGFGAFGSSNTLSYYYIGNAYNDYKLKIDASNGVATFTQTALSLSNGVYALDIDNSAQGSNMTAAGAFRISTNSSSSAFVVNGLGNVGLGTATPSYKLDVQGTLGVSGISTFLSGTIIPNGEYYRAYRVTGGASINLLGIESGTDNTVMVASNFFKLRNTGTGDAANIFTVSTYGNGLFAGTVTGGAGRFVANSTVPTGAISSYTLAASAGLYGLYFGVNTSGVSWIQSGREDTNTSYELKLNPNGGLVSIGNTLKQGSGSTFKFGNISASGVQTSTGDSYNIPIDIDGVTYYIRLFTGTN